TNREDLDCDGHLDTINEDVNHNGILDPGEDIDHDGHLDLGIEDRNHDTILNDTPHPTDNYPYGHLTPTPRDKQYTTDNRTLRTSGPFNFDYTSTRGRETVRQDLTVFVPEWHGQHEMKFGAKVERETYSQDSSLRPFVLDNVAPPTSSTFLPTA